MIIDKDEIKSELDLRPFGQKGWWKCHSVCPYCGKGEKNAILFTDKSAIFHCFKCGTKTNIVRYLETIGRKDLIHYDYTIKTGEKMIMLEDDREEELDEKQHQTHLPIGLRLLDDDEYLNKRHFLRSHYKEFEPSYTESSLEPILSKYEYIVFKLKDGDNVIAWLARTRFSKKWHKENLKRYKQGQDPLVLRYRNSEDGFSHVVGGINFVGEKTKWVILVEGLFDKVNVDYNLNLIKGDEVACCFTFGKKISPQQVKRLKETSVSNVVLLYDEDAMKESKENAFYLSRYFNTLVCRIKDKDIDPGNMTRDYLHRTLSQATDPQNFYLNNIEAISLK